MLEIILISVDLNDENIPQRQAAMGCVVISTILYTILFIRTLTQLENKFVKFESLIAIVIFYQFYVPYALYKETQVCGLGLKQANNNKLNAVKKLK